MILWTLGEVVRKPVSGEASRKKFAGPVPASAVWSSW